VSIFVTHIAFYRREMLQSPLRLDRGEWIRQSWDTAVCSAVISATTDPQACSAVAHVQVGVFTLICIVYLRNEFLLILL